MSNNSFFGTIMLKAFMRTVKPFLPHLSLKTTRKGQDFIGNWCLGGLVNALTFEEKTIDGVCTILAQNKIISDQTDIVLYLHGGAYTAGGKKYIEGISGLLCFLLQMPVLGVNYRLAPESPFPAAIDDATTAYKELLKTYAPEHIHIIGESAGGGLTLSLCLEIKRENLPHPASVVVISPWADLTNSSKSFSYNKRKDPCIAKVNLDASAKMYAGDDLKNPLVSPVFGDLSGLSDFLIIVGGNEVLLEDSKRIHDMILTSGGNSKLIIGEGLWHVYPLYRLKQSRRTIALILDFISEHRCENLQT